ncbi:inactive transglutaminase family protein [Paraferrimonas sedimenticola]|uniref:Gonadoliberin III n=1 Tax=Paraferrimonas sedimenticola TaxID=375674 RepID=A0AA37RWS3_9GAMM|nr:inactive transglutaminase family protein [Paraferrimonas sedimenticola]GLP96167.1 gonadoliberin III [Paraferrimonas sedimenticola]
MHSRKPFYFLVLLLFIAGVASIIYTHNVHKVPFVPGERVETWAVDARISFQANGDPVEVSFALPQDPAYDILIENAASPGYGLSVDQKEGKRRAVWSIREAMGRQDLFYKATFVPTGNDKLLADAEPEIPSPATWNDTLKAAASQVVAQAQSKSANNLSYAREIAKMISAEQSSQNFALLKATERPAAVFLKLMADGGVPAIAVNGIKLEDQRRRQPMTDLVAVYHQEEWHLFDPESGEEGRPKAMLLWEVSDQAVLEVTGGTNSSVTFSMILDTRSALRTAVDIMSVQRELGFSLYQLPIEEQGMFKGILLIPLGVLVVVFLRVLIGIKTSGTFMPILIALAFIQTTLLTGLIGFLLIVSVGLMIRSYLSHLNLLLISRISAVVVVVIGIIGSFTILAFKLGLSEGLTITFFPMIILAWTIERMSILWEEEGPKEVFIQGGGSLFVATLTYLAMSSFWAQHLAFNFLGVHLIVLALVLVMGQYTGYRLLELRRFKPFAEER